MDDSIHVGEEPPSKATPKIDALSDANFAFWRHLVTKHLQSRASPEAFPYLDTETRPAKGIAIRILAKTHKPKGHNPRRFDCAFCHCHNKFWDGRFVLCEDGRVRLIGHRCAARHVGVVQYRRAEKIYNDLLHRERFQRLKEKAFPLSQAFANEIAAAGRQPQHIDEAMRLPGCTSQRIPKLWDAVLMTAPFGDALKIERSTPDYAALELRRSDRPDNGRVPMKVQIFDIHAVRGINGMLPGSKPPRPCFDEAAKALRRANCLALKTDWDSLEPEKFKKCADSYEDDVRLACKRTDEGLAWMQAAKQFVSRRNVVGMCNWWNDPDNPVSEGRLVPIRNGVRWERDDGVMTDVTLPADYQLPQFPSRARLEAELKNG